MDIINLLKNKENKSVEVTILFTKEDIINFLSGSYEHDGIRIDIIDKLRDAVRL